MPDRADALPGSVDEALARYGSPLSLVHALLGPREIAALRRGDPKAAERAAQLVEIEELNLERRTCEDSLIEFFIRAWPEMGEPGEPKINWHHEVVASYLEAVARGTIRPMICNQPPRTTKTDLVNICWPAWIWAQPPHRQRRLMGPHVKFLCVSYGAKLAEDVAAKSRRLIMGEWYQRLWGDRVKIQDDQASRSNFGNTAGGERYSASIEGGLLGRGGDVTIVDDPHHIEGVESEVQRRQTIEAMRALTTRITDPQISARVLIMQRLHHADATNYALENWGDDVVHLWFPMRYDARRPCAADIRKLDGELLWADHFDERAVKQQEKELTDYGVAGQLQQMPVPRGGGIIKRDWWRLWPDDADNEVGQQAYYRCSYCNWEASRVYGGSQTECPRCHAMAERRVIFPETTFRVISVDTGIGDKETNSWSAATLWGVWHDKDEAPRVILMDAWRGRPMLRGGNTGQRGLVEVIADMANRRLADTVLIERKTRGVDLYNELSQLLRDYPWSLEYFEPTGRGDKMARLTSIQPLFTNDLVWAPDKEWSELVINEICAAPMAEHTDLTDTCSAAMIWLRLTGRLSLSHEHRREVERQETFRGRSSRFNAGEIYEGA